MWDDHVVGPNRSLASEHPVDGLLLADVLNGVGAGPDGTGGGGVVVPGQPLGIEQVSQRGMLETRILGRLGCCAAGGIDHRYQSRQGSYAARVVQSGIFGGKKRTGCRGSRSTGNDELVSREAGALIGLKHPIAERVLLGQSEIRLNVGWIDVAELRVGMRIWGALGGR